MKRFLRMQVFPPAWGWRVAVTILFLVIGVVLYTAYSSVQGSLEAEAAVRQLEDSREAYTLTQTWMSSNIPGLVMGLTTIALFCVWVPFGIKLVGYYMAESEQD